MDIRWLGMIAAAALASSGCTAMTYGSSQKVEFRSIPSGAEVEVDGRPVGSTPATLKLKRSKSHTALLSKPGYMDQSVQISSTWSGEAIGLSIVSAVLWWGPLEWLVALPLGSLKELDQTAVRARLEKTAEKKRAEYAAAQARELQKRQQTQARRAHWVRICEQTGWGSLACQYHR